MRENTYQTYSRHGYSRTKVYHCWKGMKARCCNPNDHHYEDYGGRGITVCERWMDFVNFLEDMGEPPPGLSLDRVDNSKGYSKENCRWATRGQQNRNKRTTRNYEFNGRIMCQADWATELCVKQTDFYKLVEKIGPHDAIKKLLEEKSNGLR